MKRIIIGSLVGAIIFFGFQSLMWMGGFHDDFAQYTPQQDAILQTLDHSLTEDGLYQIPTVDPTTADRMEAMEALNKESVGKPWAMVFFHKQMTSMSASYMIIGFIYALLAALIASLVLYHGTFVKYSHKFLVAFSFSVFTIIQGVLVDMNWWEFPWHFIKAQVIDLGVGWLLVSIWLTQYVRKEEGDVLIRNSGMPDSERERKMRKE